MDRQYKVFYYYGITQLIFIEMFIQRSKLYSVGLTSLCFPHILLDGTKTIKEENEKVSMCV